MRTAYSIPNVESYSRREKENQAALKKDLLWACLKIHRLSIMSCADFALDFIGIICH